MIVGLKVSIPYVIKSSLEIQLMLPGLKTNYLNALMFCNQCDFDVHAIVCDNHQSILSKFKNSAV